MAKRNHFDIATVACRHCKNKPHTCGGFGLVEVVVGIAMFVGIMVGATMAARTASVAARENLRSSKASFLIDEGIETVRIFRDSGWDANMLSLATSTDYYLSYDGIMWNATTTPAMIDKTFERKFILDDVYRDVENDIAASGTLDPNTLKLTVFVSWLNRKPTTTKSVSTYITNLFDD